MRKRVYTPGYFNNFTNRDLLSNFFSDGADYTIPAVNIKENENGYSIEVAAPGLNKEDFNIKLEKDVLTVSSENENNKEESKDNFTRREFAFKTFSRSFSIPETIDQNKIKAYHNNGILSLELPKLDEAKVKKAKTINIS
jgi:HSP20 family protein